MTKPPRNPQQRLMRNDGDRRRYHLHRQELRKAVLSQSDEPGPEGLAIMGQITPEEYLALSSTPRRK